MAEVEIRRAGPGDTAGILRLQAANQFGNLSAEERRSGFLSAEFTAGQIERMAADVGIIVACGPGSSILGFLCGFRCGFDHGSPVVARMIEQFDRLEYEGRPLAACRPFIYGPVCIDRAQRGRGLLRALYEALKRDAAGRFGVGVAFVARNNPHSLAAHVEGLGMIEAGQFDLNGREYVILAFGV